MTYRHYETEGLIVGYRNLGEANRLYQVLTRDFGLINILAQGVRRNQSKLRYHLRNFSFVILVLVRGREFWRVVGVNDFELSVKPAKEALSFLKKTTLVLQRLIQGEGLNPQIYQDLKQAQLLILNQKSLTEADLTGLEIFILARFLAQLGYLAPIAELRELIFTPNFSWADIGKVKNFKARLIKQINRALEITQL